MKMHVVCNHKNFPTKANRISTYHYFIKARNDITKLSPFASWPGLMIDSQWLKLPTSSQISMVPKMFEPLKFNCIMSIINQCRPRSNNSHAQANLGSISVVYVTRSIFISIWKANFIFSSCEGFILDDNDDDDVEDDTIFSSPNIPQICTAFWKPCRFL